MQQSNLSITRTYITEARSPHFCLDGQASGVALCFAWENAIKPGFRNIVLTGLENSSMEQMGIIAGQGHLEAANGAKALVDRAEEKLCLEAPIVFG